MVARGEAEIGIANIMEVHGRARRRHRRTCASSPRPMRCARRSSCARTPACATIADLKGKRVTHRLFRHAQDRHDRARDARHRRPDRARHQAGAGAQRGAQRRRFRLRRRRHVLLRLRRRRRCARSTPPSAASARWKSTRPACRQRTRSCRGAISRRSLPARSSSASKAYEGLQLRQRAGSPSAKVPDDFIYKILDTMDKNKADLIAVQPVLREFSPPSPTSNTACRIIRAR